MVLATCTSVFRLINDDKFKPMTISKTIIYSYVHDALQLCRFFFFFNMSFKF